MKRKPVAAVSMGRQRVVLPNSQNIKSTVYRDYDGQFIMVKGCRCPVKEAGRGKYVTEVSHG